MSLAVSYPTRPRAGTVPAFPGQVELFRVVLGCLSNPDLAAFASEVCGLARLSGLRCSSSSRSSNLPPPSSNFNKLRLLRFRRPHGRPHFRQRRSSPGGPRRRSRPTSPRPLLTFGAATGRSAHGNSRSPRASSTWGPRTRGAPSARWSSAPAASRFGRESTMTRSTLRIGSCALTVFVLAAATATTDVAAPVVTERRVAW
jgi:hypothetical protein